jgi:hypothetical protein
MIFIPRFESERTPPYRVDPTRVPHFHPKGIRGVPPHPARLDDSR